MGVATGNVSEQNYDVSVDVERAKTQLYYNTFSHPAPMQWVSNVD